MDILTSEQRRKNMYQIGNLKKCLEKRKNEEF